MLNTHVKVNDEYIIISFASYEEELQYPISCFALIIGIDANEIIGKWRKNDADQEITIICEKYIKENNTLFKCADGKQSAPVTWVNKIYNLLDENGHIEANGAITNDVFTLSLSERNEWLVFERVGR